MMRINKLTTVLRSLTQPELFALLRQCEDACRQPLGVRWSFGQPYRLDSQGVQYGRAA